MRSLFDIQALTFDKPIPYKNLLVYPVAMEKFFEFNFLGECLLLEKNTTLDGISKTYLEYLYSLQMNDDKDQNLLKFDALLKICLRKDNIIIRYVFENNNKNPIFIIYENEEDSKKGVNGDKYDSLDFDKLRLLICEQNMVEIPDERIQKEVRDSMEEARRLRIKMNGVTPPTVEDEVVCMMTATSMTLEEISKMSIRKFNQLFQRIDWKIHYEIFMTASMSGMVEFKDKSVLKHWMSGIEEDKWKGTMIDVDTMKGRLAFDDKK